MPTPFSDQQFLDDLDKKLWNAGYTADELEDRDFRHLRSSNTKAEGDIRNSTLLKLPLAA